MHRFRLVVGLLTATLCVACNSWPFVHEQASDRGGIPARCSPMHGGVTTAAPAEPLKILWGGALPSAEGDSSVVVFRVQTAGRVVPLPDAHVFLTASAGSAFPSATTDSAGLARIIALPGDYHVRVIRAGYKAWQGSVALRRAFVDTALVGMGSDIVCLY